MWEQVFERALRSYPAEPADGDPATLHSEHWLVRQLEPISQISHQSFEHKLGGIYLQSRTSQMPAEMPPLEAAFDLLSSMSSVRERSVDRFGRQWESRLAPSAGGTHSIEALLWYGAHWFVVRGGFICRVRVPSQLADQLTASVRHAARNERASSALFAVADVRLIAQRYPVGDSLLWRDAGAFLTICHLAALSLLLPSTILGLSGAVSSSGDAFTVGAVLLGVRS